MWQVVVEPILACSGDKTSSNDGEKCGLLFFIYAYSMYSTHSTFHHGEGEIADEQGGLGRLQALLNGRPAHKKALT